MVRLRDWEIDGIKNSVLKFIPTARVFLYGSRTDDSKKGGDIDLLIYCDEIPHYKIESQIRLAMEDAIGEQRIDILYSKPEEESNFVKLIKDDMVEL